MTRVAILAPLVTAIREPQLGGSQALVADIAQGLAARGHAVRLFAASGSSVDGVEVVDTGVEPSELAHAMWRAGGPDVPSSGAVRDAFARAWTLIGEDDCDVVHNHAFDAPAVEMARGPAVVHTLHLPPSPAIVEAVRAADATIACVSQTHAAAWSRHVRVDAVLRNGVPVERIGWSAESGDRLLFAGRLSPEKGAADAVRIARRAGLPIDVIGDPYDPGYASGLDAEPALPRPELWKRMAAARAVLCPIGWEEPFGLVAAEAQAAGAPVVAYRRGALPEVVGVGALVAPGDERAAADAVAREYDRTRARRHAEAHLDIRATIDAHEKLYERMVASRTEDA